MTAGRGIVHAEMPVGEQVNTGLQLWINLPAKDKMMEPRYQELLDKNVPRASTPDKGVSVKIIAGESMGVKAKVHTLSPIYYLDFVMKSGQKFVQNVPSDYTAFVYVLKGTVFFGKEIGNAHTTLVFANDGDKVEFQTGDNEEAHFVFIAGKPIGEPIVQHGPFVMNTQQEVHF